MNLTLLGPDAALDIIQSMAEQQQPSRRDFLRGKAAVDAAGQLADGTLSGAVPAVGRPAFLVSVERTAMACQFQFLLNPVQQSHATEAALEALDLVEQLEDQMTVYRDHSEISQLNRAAFDSPVAVEARLYELLRYACELSVQTRGAFDITSGPLIKTWGFFRRAGRFPTDDEIAEVLERIGSKHLLWNDAERTVRFSKPDLEINLGGIGKGHALDRCREVMLSSDVEDFLIHGGQSSVLAQGDRQGLSGWTVTLRHPLKTDEPLAEICLRNRALGTSGAAKQFFHYQGKRFGHVLNPRTGRPAEGVLSATVLAPDAAAADALSTAFYVMGVDETQAYCEEHPEIGALLVTPGARTGAVEVHCLQIDENDIRTAH